MRGIGERVQMFSRPKMLPAVMINPGVAVPTARVFAELAAPLLQQPATYDPFPEPATTGELIALIRAGRNDLEATAMRLAPVIGEVCAVLAATPGAQLARMSGSGSTCFCLYETTTAAEAAAARIFRDRPDWWVRATVLS
jgi:4-diphosphocytidyl-2-C-methyl-D-erythritol kinase